MKPRALSHETQGILDSGAFSVWSAGGTIDIPAYVKFWKEHRHIFSYIVAVDVIPGAPSHRPSSADVEIAAKLSAQNWEQMRDLLPDDHDRLIPVYHQGEHIQHLEYYVSRGASYIGLSPVSIAGDASHAKHSWMRHMAQLLPASVKTHGFGVVSLNEDASFLTSRDSSSWARLPGYGTVPVRSFGRWGIEHITHSYKAQALQLVEQALENTRDAGIPLPPQITAEGMISSYGVRALYGALVHAHASTPPRTYVPLCLSSLVDPIRRYLPHNLLASYALLRNKKGGPSDLYQRLIAPLPDDDHIWAELNQARGFNNATAPRRSGHPKGLSRLFNAE